MKVICEIWHVFICLNTFFFFYYNCNDLVLLLVNIYRVIFSPIFHKLFIYSIFRKCSENAPLLRVYNLPFIWRAMFSQIIQLLTRVSALTPAAEL